MGVVKGDTRSVDSSSNPGGDNSKLDVFERL